MNKYFILIIYIKNKNYNHLSSIYLINKKYFQFHIDNNLLIFFLLKMANQLNINLFLTYVNHLQLKLQYILNYKIYPKF